MIFGFPFYCHLEFHAMNIQGHEMGKTPLLSAAASRNSLNKKFIENLFIKFVSLLLFRVLLSKQHYWYFEVASAFLQNNHSIFDNEPI